MEPLELTLPVIVGDDIEVDKEIYDQRFNLSLVRPFVGDLKMLFAHGNAAEVYTDYFLPNAVLFQGKHVKDEDDHDYHFPPDLIDVLQPHGALAVIARMKMNIDDSKRIPAIFWQDMFDTYKVFKEQAAYILEIKAGGDANVKRAFKVIHSPAAKSFKSVNLPQTHQ